MRCIVDTHILLWTLLDPDKLSKRILQAYEVSDEIQVSNINFWEVSLKYSLGKLDLEGLTPEDICLTAKESNFNIININAQTTSSLYQLPLRDHKDPFDRLLIWYAIQHKITLLSKDGKFEQYKEDGLLLIQ